jgi:hypothetical protein
MSSATGRTVALIAVLTLMTAVAAGQDPAVPKKRVPTMSNEDLGNQNSGVGGSSASEMDISPLEKSAGPLPSGWARYSPEGCGLTIALPGKPQTFDIPAAEQLGFSLKMYGYLGEYMGDRMSVLATHTVSAVEGPVREVAEGFFVGLKVTPGVSDLQYYIDSGDGPRLGLRAVYTQNGVPLGFEGFLEGHKRSFWVVGTMYPQASPQSLALGRKAVASARFNGKPCKGE